MSSQVIRDYEESMLRKDIPEFRPGDTVRVSVRITEGDKERIQDFEGFVLKRKGGGLRETFTVRRMSYGVGMERTFPLHSPKLDKITVVRRGKVRRAKLYYMRELRGKAARIVELKTDVAPKSAKGGARGGAAAAPAKVPQTVAAPQPEGQSE